MISSAANSVRLFSSSHVGFNRLHQHYVSKSRLTLIDLSQGNGIVPCAIVKVNSASLGTSLPQVWRTSVETKVQIHILSGSVQVVGVL